MSGEKINLLDLFKDVSASLKENQSTLNDADDYNHDHGDHMVEIFEVITEAMKEKKNADPADQLEYAAQLLRNKSQSGSAQMYVKGLTQASKELSGKQALDLDNVVPLMQMLLGGGEAQIVTQTKSGSGLGDILGSLLGGAAPASEASDADQGLDLSDLLGAGLSYMQTKQSGGSDIEALTKALVGGSQMGSKPYRAQSSELVTNTVLQMLSGMLSK